MKNLFIILVLLTCSISLFSCTTDDSDLAQQTTIEENTLEEISRYEEGHVAPDEDDD